MNINKVLFIFLSIMMLSVFGLWQFAHTEKFANFLSSKLKETFLKNFNGEVSFDSIEIGVFPLSTKIKNMTLETDKKDGKKIYCNFDEVGFYFSPVDLLSSKLVVAKAIIQGGFLKYENDKTSSWTARNQIRIEKVFSYYKETRIGKTLQRIKAIQIKNTNLNDLIDVDDVKIKTYKNYITLAGNLDKFSTGKLHKVFNRAYDSIDFSLEIERERVRIKKLEVKEELEIAVFKGEIKEHVGMHSVEGRLNYKGRVGKAFELTGLKFPYSDKFLGYVDTSAEISGDIKKPIFKINFEGERINSPYFVADKLKGAFSLVSDRIVVDKMHLARRGGTIDLLDSVELFDIKNKKIISGSAQLQTNKILSEEAFRALKFLDVVKGSISGAVKFEWNNEQMIIEPEEGLYVDKFKLSAEKGDPILINDKMTFNKGKVIVEHGREVYIELDISFPGNRFRGKGVVSKEGVNFLMDNSRVDFLRLGRVSGAKIHGKGDLSMHILGPFEDVWFNLGLDLDDFEIANYKLKNIEGDVKISLKNKSLHFNNVKSEQEVSRLSGDGKLFFGKNSQLDLNIKVKRASLEESYFTAAPVFNHLREKFKNVRAKYSGNVSVKIDFKKDKVVTKGSFYTDDISFYVNEYVDVLSARFFYENKKMLFDNIEVKKGNGTLKGRLEINTARDYFKYEAKLRNLEIKDVYLYRLSNIQYNGKIFGTSSGEGTLNQYQIKTDLEAVQGRIGKRNVQNGKMTIHANQDSFKMKGNFLGEIVKIESDINFGNKISYIRGEIDAPDISILMGLLSRRNSSNERIRGSLKKIWNISFNTKTLNIVDVDVDMKEFNFKYDRLALNLVDGRNRVWVKNSEIIKWDIGIKGNGYSVTSVGRGNLAKDFEIKQEFKLDALLGMLIFSQIEKIYGDISGQHIISSRKNEFESKMLFDLKDVSLKIKGMANTFSKTNIRVAVLEDKAVIKKFNAVFGDGVIKGDGHVLLSIPYPAIDINVKMENSKISFFNKSGIVASANMYLKGNEAPYRLSGKISVLHGNVKDEVKDILKNFSTLKNYNKYIPQKTNNNVFGYLNYDLGVSIFNPITVSNSLFDVKMEGEGKIRGSMDNPIFSGNLDVIKGESKLMFKNHDFIVNEGQLTFSGNNKTPRIKLVGAADVDDYSVKLNVSGDFESTEVKLNSTPPLSQQDIISLLALGVTSNMNKDLNEKDRQSITTLSFGSLVVEQLKLHEGLTSSLGLRLSVQPEFQENQSGPLEGRIDKKESSEKIKTATKIKVQKKISNNVDLSLSSTLGSSNEQKQIMNIIYQVNKNLSLEGIYEINASDTAIEESPDSGGIDIKYRISF